MSYKPRTITFFPEWTSINGNGNVLDICPEFASVLDANSLLTRKEVADWEKAKKEKKRIENKLARKRAKILSEHRFLSAEVVHISDVKGQGLRLSDGGMLQPKPNIDVIIQEKSCADIIVDVLLSQGAMTKYELYAAVRKLRPCLQGSTIDQEISNLKRYKRLIEKVDGKMQIRA